VLHGGFCPLGTKHITLFQVGDPVGLLLVFFLCFIWGRGEGGSWPGGWRQEGGPRGRFGWT